MSSQLKALGWCQFLKKLFFVHLYRLSTGFELAKFYLSSFYLFKSKWKKRMLSLYECFCCSVRCSLCKDNRWSRGSSSTDQYLPQSCIRSLKFVWNSTQCNCILWVGDKNPCFVSVSRENNNLRNAAVPQF